MNGVRSILIASVLFLSFLMAHSNPSASDTHGEEVELPGTRASFPHDPVRINSDIEFHDIAAVEKWPGSGTQADPYIIYDLDIDCSSSGFGLFIGNVTLEFIVSNCEVYSSYGKGGQYYWNSAIAVYNTTRGMIRNCTTYSSFNGIVLNTLSGMELINNTCYGNTGSGIVCEYVSEVLLDNNNCTSNGVGMSLRYSDDNVIEQNHLAGNGQGYGCGLEMSVCYGNNVNHNNCSDNSYFGIYLEGSESNMISNNTCLDHYFEGEGPAGIHLTEASRSNTIKHNNCSHNDAGITVSHGSSKNLIVSNSVLDTITAGIRVYFHSDDNVIEDNLVSESIMSGILAESSNRTRVLSNEVHHCSHGVRVSRYSLDLEPHGSVVSDNYLFENQIGLRLEWAHDSFIENNDVIRSLSVGIYEFRATTGSRVIDNLIRDSEGLGLLTIGGGGLIRHNRFIHNNGSDEIYDPNHIQAMDDGDLNRWDLNGTGNHWSDWTTPDDDSNGIVDLPYDLLGSAETKDNHPLADPYPPRMEIPSAPRNLSSMPGMDFINISWEGPEDDGGQPIQGYVIYRDIGTRAPDVIAEVGPDILFYNDTDVERNRTYVYNVSALNIVGESPLSEGVRAELDIFLVPPSINITGPLNDTAVQNGSFEVSWDAVLPGVTLLRYEVRVDGGNWTDVGTNTSYPVSDLSEGRHVIEVRVLTMEGLWNLTSVTVMVDISSPFINLTSPEGSMFNRTEITFRWEAYDNISEVVNVSLELDGMPPIHIGSEDNWTATNLSEGSHKFVIRALDKAGNSANITLEFSIDTTRPQLLNWGPQGEDIPLGTALSVEFSEEIYFPSLVISSVPDITGTTIWEAPNFVVFTPNDDLEPYTMYRVRVTALDPYGNRLLPFEWYFGTEDPDESGTVGGTVKDEDGQGLSGVDVLAADGSGNEWNTSTNIYGEFSLTLEPGNYNVSFSKPGYEEVHIEIELGPGQTRIIDDITLRSLGGGGGDDGEDDGLPWIPVIIIIVIISTVLIGYLTLKARSGQGELDFEE